MRADISWHLGWISMVAIHAAVALEVDFETNMGTFTVALEQTHTPLATANFIRLANGGTWWRDSRTGRLETRPLYHGALVDEVVMNGSERFLEFGDPGAPGYEFSDEFHPDLRHLPYVLAMAAEAPNTNGARMRIFGVKPHHPATVGTRCLEWWWQAMGGPLWMR